MSDSPTTMPNTPTTIERAGALITDLVAVAPATIEPASTHPRQRAREIAESAARKAAFTAGSLALPPGPLGWLTVLPELTLIWRIQAQMVADIAAAYGRRSPLSRDQMLYCLFRHTAAQAFRDVGVRLGQRSIVQALSSTAFRRLIGHVGISISRRTVARGVSRWLPVVGAAGVAAYAWYDSRRVADTAIALFDADGEAAIDVIVESRSEYVPARRVVHRGGASDPK